MRTIALSAASTTAAERANRFRRKEKGSGRPRPSFRNCRGRRSGLDSPVGRSACFAAAAVIAITFSLEFASDAPAQAAGRLSEGSLLYFLR